MTPLLLRRPRPCCSFLLLASAAVAAVLLPRSSTGFVATTRAFSRTITTRRSKSRRNPSSVVVTAAVNGADSIISKNDTSTTTLEAPKQSSSSPTESIADRIRSDFEILDRTITDQNIPLLYLDSAATSHKPKSVISALTKYYTQTNSNVHRGAHTLSRESTTAYEAARDKVAHFIQAPGGRNEIVFTSGATESINLVAQSYGRAFLNEGDEIILTVAEHHANLVPWQMLAQEKNLKIHFIGLDPESGGLDWSQLDSLLSDKTKLVAFQHVSNVLGCIHPVHDIVAQVRAKCPDAKILLDACQSVPHMPVNVHELGVDFLAASGHKMCGPTGIGFLWGREALLNEMPPWKGGGEMIDQVTLEGATWQQAPGRFEAGTPAIAQAIGLGVAIDYLTAIGMDAIEAYEHELAQYLFDRMKQDVPGLTIIGPQQGQQRVALCAFSHDNIHPSDLSSFLDMEGVAVRAGHHCCQPLHQALGLSHSARASLYIYNTKEDIDLFIQKLISTIEFFDSIQGSGNTDSRTAGEDDFVPFI